MTLGKESSSCCPFLILDIAVSALCTLACTDLRPVLGDDSVGKGLAV